MSIEATEFMKEAHKGQQRDDGTPYFLHPLRVADSLVQYDICEADSDWHIAAKLHDVVEDTTKTLDDIKKKFGETVASIVEELTNKHPPKTPFAVKHAALLEHARNYSEPAKYIKLADRFDNLRSCQVAWEPKRVQRYVFATGELLGAMNIYKDPKVTQMLGDMAIMISYMQ